jgi:hypothetical protein
MNSINCIGELKDGKLHIVHREKFINSLQTCANGKYSLSLEKIYNKRSVNQNAYYWAVVVPLVREGLYEVGYKLDNADTHEYLKETFLRGQKTNENTGEVKYINRSTASLKTVEFNEYFEKIIQWAAEYLSIKIPYPNEL